MPDPNSRSQPQSQPQAQRPRSRSKVQRRFSGSTVNSSHSPSSDRTPHGKEREEAKPAPLGIIGVCALDSKARSKPSRNILNRLVGNREFDVVVFGDKTILDEGNKPPYELNAGGTMTNAEQRSRIGPFAITSYLSTRMAFPSKRPLLT